MLQNCVSAKCGYQKAIVTIFVTLTFALAVAACQGPGKKEKGRGTGGNRGAKAPINVTTISIKTKEIADELQTVIPLFGQEQTEVFSRVQGRVAAIGKVEGDPVAARSVLFQIERTEPGESFLAVPVTSPINGWIGRVLVTKGQQVSTQDPLAVVVSDAVLRGIISLPQDAFAKVRRDTSVSLKSESETFPARIVSIARAAAADAGRGNFTVEMDNKDHKLRAGSIVTAAISLGVRPRIIIPAGAMRITDQGAYVYVAQGDAAKKMPVKFALRNATEVEILNGLEPGMALVVSGANQLTDGSSIKVISSDGAPASETTGGAEPAAPKAVNPDAKP